MRSQIKGALYVAGAMILFSVMSSVVKLVSSEVSSSWSVFARGIVGTILIYVYAKHKHIDLTGKRKALLSIRAISGTIALVMVFYAFTKIPTANAMLLNQMTPVFIIPLAVIFLKEKTSWIHVMLALLAFAGVAMVLKPSIAGVNIPGVLALVSALFAAIAYLLVRKLTQTENSLTIVFWFSAISTMAVIPMLPSGDIEISLRSLTLLVTIGVLGLVGQLFLTAGFRLGEAAKLAVIGSTSAIFCAIWDYLIFDHSIDLITAIGGIIVISSCAIIQVLRTKSK
ncbi:MAG: DMT family transporter [Deltaproteobacteria bacterium]|nr:DMT family transporter [Deltaproteobacteria bacterium]